VGNPVRAEILALPAPEQRLAGRGGRVRLLVLGGSGGALAINTLMPAALARLPAEARPEVRHQAGRTHQAARTAYREHGVAADLTTYIDDMAAAYAWADLAVCRAGALTVAELAAAGLGALLIPYPHAVDDHQRGNGEYLVRRDAAELIPQAALDAGRLADRLAALCGDRDRLRRMAAAARAAAWPRATAEIADACLEAAA
jgi:UDP-N-acetylglucosamine--N-acetylmuramyl-(pentapeptide) pyrophosphoryl-undecaprenol N-acetylglucosamine transferase